MNLLSHFPLFCLPEILKITANAMPPNPRDEDVSSRYQTTTAFVNPYERKEEKRREEKKRCRACSCST